MKFASRDELIARLRNVFGTGDELRFAETIIDMIVAHPATTHIPYSHLSKLGKQLDTPASPAVIQRVIDYFTGADSHVLDLRAEIVEEDDNVYTLDEEQFRSVLDHQINPLTGRRDEKILDSVFIFFSPSDIARQVLWHASSAD